MDRLINIGMESLNEIGRRFCDYAGALLLQTIVLIAVLLVVDFLMRKRIRAAFRYWLWMLVFVKLLLPPTLALPTGIGYWWDRPVAALAPVTETSSPDLTSYQPAQASAPMETHAPAAVSSTQPADVSPEAGTRPAPLPEGGPVLTWQALAFALWLVGVLVFCVLLIQRACFVRGLVAQSAPAERNLLDVLNQCARQLGVSTRVRLRISPNTFSPAVCGLLRPVILLPASLLDKLSQENLKAVLIHELAHVKRGDLWFNFVQTLLQVIYFYNPLVWLAHAIVRRVREQAVDETVLVALGAEAQRYSHTLIDIAEMALFRPNLALRLIGVAESKRSLERRIKHMLTRPIPKKATVGFGGLVAILATGAVLLPMARAQHRESRDDSIVAHLPGGATVELLGVCSWPKEGRQCWRPDGTDPSNEIYATKWNTQPGPGNYGFMLKVSGPKDLQTRWRTIEGTKSWEGSCQVEDSQGRVLNDCTAAISDMEAGKISTSIRIGVATGAWSTLSSHDGKGMMVEGGVLWSRSFEDLKGTHIIVSTEWRKDRSERIVAVDSEGRVYPGQCGSVASGKVDQYTASFRDLSIDQIRQFRFQVRPYDWVQFNNVSLRPGRRTTVTVDSPSSSEEIASRRQSAKNLSDLSKALLIYAHDFDDQFPNTLQEAKDYISEYGDFSWVQQNVAYLGRGVTARDKPTRVLAYDKTLLEKGNGTAVLYLDSHAAFEKPETLEGLGIDFR